MDAFAVVEQAVFDRFPKTARAPSVVLRTDGGPEFVAHRFQDACRAIGISLEASIKRRPKSNGMIESTIGHLKGDYLWTREPTTFLETRVRLRETVEDYNSRRPHLSLAYQAPLEFAKRKMSGVKV